eukprot:PhF_6_TR42812/c0_g1_i1/m.64815
MNFNTTPGVSFIDVDDSDLNNEEASGGRPPRPATSGGNRRGSLATMAVMQKRENDDFFSQANKDCDQLVVDQAEMANMLSRKQSLNQNSYFDLHYWSDEVNRVWTTNEDGSVRRSSILQQRAAKEKEMEEKARIASSVGEYVLYSHPLIGRRLRRSPAATNPKVQKVLGEYRPGTYKNYLVCNGLEKTKPIGSLLKRPTSAPPMNTTFNQSIPRATSPPGSRPVSAASTRHSPSRPTSAAERSVIALDPVGDQTLSPSMTAARFQGSAKINYKELFAEQKALLDATESHRREVYGPILETLNAHNSRVQRKFSMYLRGEAMEK